MSCHDDSDSVSSQMICCRSNIGACWLQPCCWTDICQSDGGQERWTHLWGKVSCHRLPLSLGSSFPTPTPSKSTSPLPDPLCARKSIRAPVATQSMSTWGTFNPGFDQLLSPWSEDVRCQAPSNQSSKAYPLAWLNVESSCPANAAPLEGSHE